MEGSKRTILITGATDGLGKALAIEMAQPGTLLLLHGRDARRGAEIRGAAEREGARAIFLQADFAALDEVERLGDIVARDHSPLHLLVNNAGIGFGHPFQRRQESRDGHELRFQLNYLAPLLLTDRLLSALAAADSARIVNVASIGQYPIDFADLMLTRGYSGARAYRQAKLAMIMWTFDLAERLRDTGITVNALHPATFMNTRMVRQGGGIPLSSVAEGVAAVMELAVGSKTAGITGVYFEKGVATSANPQAYDPVSRAALRNATLGLIGDHLLKA